MGTKQTLHKCIASIFGNHNEHNVELESSQSSSDGSTLDQKLKASTHGSVPSIDLVSPTPFLFSGPSLRSAQSKIDMVSSRTRHERAGGDQPSLGRAHTDSFSMIDDTNFAKETLLEPLVKRDAVQIMSDVLFDQITSTEHGGQLSGHLHRGLPVEIVQYIFTYLGPLDFNSARHSCRS